MAPSLALFFSIQETDQTRTGGWDPSREPAGFAIPTSIAATWQRPQFASTQFVLRIASTATDGPVEAPDGQHPKSEILECTLRTRTFALVVVLN